MSPTPSRFPNRRYAVLAAAAIAGASMAMVPAQDRFEWTRCVAADERVSPIAKAYAHAIAEHTSGGGAALHESAWASYNTYAREMSGGGVNRHRRTLIDANHELEAFGYLVTRRMYRTADRKRDERRRTNRHTLMVTAEAAAARRRAVAAMKAPAPSNLVRGIVELVRSHESIAYLGTIGFCDRLFRIGEQHKKSVDQVKEAITSIADEQAALLAAQRDGVVDAKGRPVEALDGHELVAKLRRRIIAAKPIEGAAPPPKLERHRFDDGTLVPLPTTSYSGRPSFDPPPLRSKPPPTS